MNFTVIPFLLGALVSVEDVKKWNFGPEYIFKLKRSVRVYIKKDVYIGGKVTAVINCRLKVPSTQSVQNVLFCRASNIFMLNITQQKYDSWKEIIDNSNTPHNKSNKIPDQLFKIEFGRKGVQNYKLKAKIEEQHYSDIVTDIIDQLDIGIDLTAARKSMKHYENEMRRSYEIFTFTQYKENTTKATKCDTAGSIKYTPSDRYNKGRKFSVQRNKRRFDFRLKLLPLYYRHPGRRTFVIERIRKACTHRSEYFKIFNEIWTIQNLNDYFNKMKINDTEPKFSSYTHYEGDAYFPHSLVTYHFWQDVYLQLVSIKPAREELNTAEYE